MTGDWRDFRPAIWLAMLGVAAMLLFSPWFLGAIFLGGAVGVAAKTLRGRRRVRLAEASRTRGSRGSRGSRR